MDRCLAGRVDLPINSSPMNRHRLLTIFGTHITSTQSASYVILQIPRIAPEIGEHAGLIGAVFESGCCDVATPAADLAGTPQHPPTGRGQDRPPSQQQTGPPPMIEITSLDQLAGLLLRSAMNRFRGFDPDTRQELAALAVAHGGTVGTLSGRTGRVVLHFPGRVRGRVADRLVARPPLRLPRLANGPDQAQPAVLRLPGLATPAGPGRLAPRDTAPRRLDDPAGPAVRRSGAARCYP